MNISSIFFIQSRTFVLLGTIILHLTILSDFLPTSSPFSVRKQGRKRSFPDGFSRLFLFSKFCFKGEWKGGPVRSRDEATLTQLNLRAFSPYWLLPDRRSDRLAFRNSASRKAPSVINTPVVPCISKNIYLDRRNEPFIPYLLIFEW